MRLAPPDAMLRPGAALLFDIDGTLADTDHWHLVAFNEVFQPFDHHFDRARYTRELQGISNAAIAARFLAGQTAETQRAVIAAKENAFRRLAAAGLAPLPGLMTVLESAARLAIPVAAVTNAPRANADLILRSIGLAERFSVVIIGDELPRGKPDPLPYLEGLKALGADPRHALAFEDSRSGIASASGAGIATIGMLTSLDAEAARDAGAVETAEDFNAPAIGAWVLRRLFA